MDKSEIRRQQLIALAEALGHGGIALIAAKIGKEPSYVSRMLYEPTKAGKKRVTEASADLLDRFFPGWFEDPKQAVLDLGISNADRAHKNKLLRSSLPPLIQDSKVTIQTQSPSDLALSTLVQLVRSTDDLTRDQIRPLVNRMFDEPERAAEIAARIGSTIQIANNRHLPAGPISSPTAAPKFMVSGQTGGTSQQGESIQNLGDVHFGAPPPRTRRK